MRPFVRFVFVVVFALGFASEAGAVVRWPAGLHDIPTTSGVIYLGNLDARIDALDAANRRSPRVDLQVAQAGALYHRYRIRGKLTDAEAALVLLDAALAQSPEKVDALSLRATVLSGFHRFSAASADLDAAAAAMPKKAASLADARREISLATGRYGDLREDFSRSGQSDGEFYELAFRGNLLLQSGDQDGASAQFKRAQSLFTDSSPMPLAWLHVQQGIALLRHQRYADAAVFFRAAHERLPGFTLATEHLAETQMRLGNYSDARALYHEVIADTGSPEFIAALAGVERADGHVTLAAQLDDKAKAEWSRLVAKYPAAFAQHAIPFYLDHGDNARALALARSNIELRQDVGSYIMLARAAHAAGDEPLACAARKSAWDTGLNPPELVTLDALAEHCPMTVASH